MDIEDLKAMPYIVAAGLGLLALAIVAFIAVIAYTLWHAATHDELRRLEYFTFGECCPPATDEEIQQWNRGF